jgi:uncharacterized damage-inducible protein DinB
MITQDLKLLFHRDLEKLKQEILAYQNESTIWKVEKNISNSAGNLCLHLIGNLNTYIGAVLGNTGYIRHRELEFSLKDVLRLELVQKIEDTLKVIENVLDKVSQEQLEQEYPMQVLATKTTTQYFLIHLLAHLNYHLGQINYHRRLLDVQYRASS